GGLLATVGNPHVTLEVDVDAVGPHDHTLAETDNHVAVLVELHDRVQLAADAGANVATAALGHPDADAIRVDVDGAGRAPGSAFRHFCPTFDGLVRVGQVIDWIHIGLRMAEHRQGCSDRSGKRKSH